MLAVDAFDAETLFRYMDEHGLVSEALKRVPGLMANLQKASSYCIWNDGKDPLALMLEIPSMEPDCLNVMIIPDDKTLGKKKNDVIEFGWKLRERWFDCFHMRRVEAKVPASRVNMQRIMRGLGFKLETPNGLHYAVRLGEEPESMLIYGLWPELPPRDRVKEPEDVHLKEGICG